MFEPEPLIRCKEERPVPARIEIRDRQRTAERPAEIVLAQGRLSKGIMSVEPVIGIKDIVA